MTRPAPAAAPGAPPPPGADELRRWGLDPAWSRRVDVPGHDGSTRSWHVLDTGPPSGPPAAPTPAVTIVCLHGNPTWSVLWASFLHRLGDRHRVVAPDQLGMGYSERAPSPRSYAQRVADLDDVLRAVGVSGPVVLAAHDWGGAIAMGWAVERTRRSEPAPDVELVGLVLANTGVAVPHGRSAPGIIRLAATPGVHHLATRRTPLFVRGTGWLSRGRLTRVGRQALAAPYRRAAHRTAIGDFVGDIPFTPAHPSAAAIDATAAALGDLDVPVLLAWGGRDPVFDDDFAADLLARFRDADLHRFPTAGHLVVAESTGDAVPGPSVAEVADEWLAARVLATDRSDGGGGPEPVAATSGHRPVWAAIDERANGPDAGAVAFHDAGTGRSITFAELHRMVAAIAAGLRRRGVVHGDRVALLVPPSVELVALVYACWRIGAVTVIADRGLGLPGLGRAVRGARVRTVIGPRRALVAARALRWAPSAATIELGDVVAMAASDDAGDRAAVPDAVPDPPGPDDLAAVLFTSGATGPAKGVRYTHERLAGQRDALTALYDIGPHDRFVAAFAPFALYGPALGITSAVPDVDVTTPGALTADVLDRACAAVDATMVFASPAALANVVRTAHGPLPALGRVRTVMSAGAPVPIRTLRTMATLAPAATLHTPYGMTEALPVADIDLAGIDLAGNGGVGVCVGRPVAGCDVVIVALGSDVVAACPVGHTGEVLVRSAWMSAGYDGLWRTEHGARPVDVHGREWHRSGDVGHLDDEGRLWIEGRLVHVVHTVHGPVTPVPVEIAVETLDDVRRAAAVGVGPVGIQQLVVVVETDRDDEDGLADVALAERVRAAVQSQVVAAVCTRAALPVDIRHNAKIDRADVATWAARLLAGGAT